MYSAYFKHYGQLPYELQVDRLLHDFNFLNESQHIYKGSRNAVHYIALHIFNDLNNQRYKAQDFNSGFSFISNYGVAISDKESNTIDMHSNFKKFPINVHYLYIEDSGLFMFVCDRAIHTNDIMIVVNTYRMIPYLDSFKTKIETKKKSNKFNEALDDDYDYFLLVPKIKHEFLHIRQNYGLTFKDISQTKKMVNIDIEQLFNFKYNDYIYEIIKRYMYMFGFSELSQRINETVEIISCLSDKKIMYMTEDCTQRSDCCTKMFNYTSSVHMVPQMRELKNDISDTIQEDGFDIVMPIAYFFNHYKMFKTNLYISKEHIQEIINYRQSIGSNTTEPAITNKDKKFCKEFLTWLTNLIYEFQANVYTAIHYHLYTRFWEFQDIEDFNLSKRADILKKTIQYKREAD